MASAPPSTSWLTRRLLTASIRLDTEVPEPIATKGLKALVTSLLAESLVSASPNPSKTVARQCYASLLIARSSYQGQNTVEAKIGLSIIEQALSLEKIN